MIDPEQQEVKKEYVQPQIIQHSYKLDIRLYPTKCPHCGGMVEAEGQIHQQMYPITGHTKVQFKKKKKLGKPTQAVLQSEESY